MAPRVGDTGRRTRVVRARDIVPFTEPTGDRNPLMSTKTPRHVRFGGLIAPRGGVTSGLLNAVVAEEVPGPGSVPLHVDWSFRAPGRPGDEITAEAEFLEVREQNRSRRGAPPSSIRTARRRSRRRRAGGTEPL